MAKNCCGGACGCVLTSGTGVTVEGGGSANDPFVISSNVFEPIDNDTFEITITGSGEEDVPYTLEIEFASTASVRNFPDWDDSLPSNGQVPVWSTALQKWVPGANTPAASGSVIHDVSLDGDGAIGDPLMVVHEPDRYTETYDDGIGVSGSLINQLVRRFSTEGERDDASPTPDLNTISALDSDPGKLDYWDGTAWKPVQAVPVVSGAAFLELSGAYVAGSRTVTLVKTVTVTTDVNGAFTILGSSELGLYAGVLSVMVQPVGLIPFAVVASTLGGTVVGTAYRLDTGTVYPSQPIQALVTAIVY